MVLGGDHHLAGFQIFDRLIGSPMAEFQFECPSTKGQPQKLVAQTDAEDRFFAHELTDRLNGIRNALRVARTIGQEDSVRLVGEDRLCRGGGRQDDDFTVPLPKRSEDIVFDSEVQNDHLRSQVESGRVRRRVLEN